MFHALEKLNVEVTCDRKLGLLSRVIAAGSEGVCDEDSISS